MAARILLPRRAVLAAPLVLDAGAAARAQSWRPGQQVRIVSGAGTGQTATITAYDPETGTYTLDRQWTRRRLSPCWKSRIECRSYPAVRCSSARPSSTGQPTICDAWAPR